MTHFINKSKLTEKFSTVPNALIQNFIVSLEARGLLVYLLSLPPDWKLNIKDLSKKNNLGENKIRKLVNELIECKYIIRVQDRVKNGTFKSFDYFIYDTPQTQQIRPVDDLPQVDIPQVDIPLVDIRDTYKVNKVQNKHNKKETYTDAFEEFWKVCKRKQGKDRTFKKYQEIIKTVDSAILIKKMKQYNEEKEECKTEIQYYKNPYTWLHQKGWEDEYIAEKDEEPTEDKILESWLHKHTKLGYQLPNDIEQKLIQKGMLNEEKEKAL